MIIFGIKPKTNEKTNNRSPFDFYGLMQEH